jgi:hypothetical protein
MKLFGLVVFQKGRSGKNGVCSRNAVFLYMQK